MNKQTDNDNIPELLAKGYILLFALLPWSVECSFGSWNLSLPCEPLIALLGIGLLWSIKTTAIKSLAAKPLFAISFLWILWMAISVCFSSMKTVSVKYWLVEAGQWWVFGIGMALWPGLWQRVLPCFIFSMLGVAIYTIIHHGFFAFRADQALLAPMPFFPDHTMYAAVLAMLFFFVQIKDEGKGMLTQWLQRPGVRNGMALFFLSALLLSTCRAALLSLGITGAVFVLFYLYKKQRLLALAAAVLGACCFLFIAEKFVDPVAKDVSVQERLNRWDCAQAMLATQPWTGYGPGTYPFQYQPFQQPEKMTRISLRTPLLIRGPETYGRGGSAHSEYWQAASEMGWPGLALWLALVSSVLCWGFRMAVRSTQKTTRYLALLSTLGLLTFFIHALANNFLHDARIAAMVWGGMAWLISVKSFNPPELHPQTTSISHQDTPGVGLCS